VVLQLVKKRFGLSDAELTEIGDRIGNSLSEISKDVGLQRANRLPDPAQ
jgi:hypothetical protein